MSGSLPNLIIIGAMKCGTTALHMYLDLHPQIEMSSHKELNFFVSDKDIRPGLPGLGLVVGPLGGYSKYRWDRGIDWYAENFTKGSPVRGESSPSYTRYPILLGIPDRMHALIPEAKLIYIVRDPVERIISNYQHYLASGRETRSLDDAMESTLGNGPPPPRPHFYMERSSYFLQISQFLEYYGRDQLLLLSQERLLEDCASTLRRVFRFLGVDDGFTSAVFGRRFYQTSRKRVKTRVGLAFKRTIGDRAISALPHSWRYHADLALYFPFPFSRPIQPLALRPSLRRKLIEALRDDIVQFRQLCSGDSRLEREVDSWLTVD